MEAADARLIATDLWTDFGNAKNEICNSRPSLQIASAIEKRQAKMTQYISSDRVQADLA